MAFGKKSAIKAANREDDRLEDLKDERTEDREESKKVAAPAPVRVKGEPQFYPKWMKLGDMPVVVENAAQEKAVNSGTAKVEIVKSAQGDQIKIV